VEQLFEKHHRHAGPRRPVDRACII